MLVSVYKEGSGEVAYKHDRVGYNHHHCSIVIIKVFTWTLTDRHGTNFTRKQTGSVFFSVTLPPCLPVSAPLPPPFRPASWMFPRDGLESPVLGFY